MMVSRNEVQLNMLLWAVALNMCKLVDILMCHSAHHVDSGSLPQIL